MYPQESDFYSGPYSVKPPWSTGGYGYLEHQTRPAHSVTTFLWSCLPFTNSTLSPHFHIPAHNSSRILLFYQRPPGPETQEATQVPEPQNAPPLLEAMLVPGTPETPSVSRTPGPQKQCWYLNPQMIHRPPNPCRDSLLELRTCQSQ